MISCLVHIFLAYLVGSVSGSLLLGRFRGVDIRSQGSGNAGGTNALRTQGWLFALGVVVIDIGKGALAAGVVPLIPVMPAESAVGPGIEVTRALCGLAAILGHVYPLYHGFRGGKGAATYVGVLAVLLPSALLPVFLIWVVTILLTGYVGLATILAAVGAVPLGWWLVDSLRLPPVLGFMVLSTLLILFAHRSNIRRLIQGGEHRFEKAMVSNWFKKPIQ